MSFDKVEKFEKEIAEYFNAPYAVATDSCTHAIELCLRYTNADFALSPKHTYLSIPMMFEKLNLNWKFKQEEWQDYYYVTSRIIDAAVLWRKNSFVPGTFMCLSFQFKKHLSLGRGGIVLCDNKKDAEYIKRMSYDGRDRNTPWAEQNIDMIGYHYYMTPETADLGSKKLSMAIYSKPKTWSWKDYPDLSKLPLFADK